MFCFLHLTFLIHCKLIFVFILGISCIQTYLHNSWVPYFGYLNYRIIDDSRILKLVCEFKCYTKTKRDNKKTNIITHSLITCTQAGDNEV